MFSYNKGVPIAKIIGGPDDGKEIYMNDESVDPIDRLSKDFKATYKDDLSVKEIKELHKALRMNDEPDKPKLKKIYNDAIDDLKDEQAFDCLKLKKGKIQPLPRKNICEKLYVAGVSGSGVKSRRAGGTLGSRAVTLCYPPGRALARQGRLDGARGTEEFTGESPNPSYHLHHY